MRVRLRSLAAAAFGGALAAATLGGCGSSSPADNGVAARAPGQIVAAAESAAAGAVTVRVTGSILSAKKPISLHMELVADKGGKGRLSLEGFGVRLIDLNRAVYINANSAFYRRFAGPVAARLLPGRWLKARAYRGPLASLALLANLGKLIDGALSAHGRLTRAPGRTIGGQRAVGVTDAAGGGTLYVAATGTPYPIEIVTAAGAGDSVRFDRWNKPVSLQAPPNPISISQLHGGR
jgi:hypothetical protein